MVVPPLPAPTEPSTLDSSDQNNNLSDDVATDVSTRTDKTSYSIPEDGTPVTINTTTANNTNHNTKKQGPIHKKYPSQTSLLIEYFEGGKTEGKANSRPSVRVRVTPSRKNKAHKAEPHLQITQTSRNAQKPSYIRRIPLSQTPSEIAHTGGYSYSEESNVSSIPPVDIEVLQNESDISSHAGRYIPPMSDISSMPADSMLEDVPAIKPPGPRRRRSRSLDREEAVESTVTDTLKAPTRRRSRSLSKERITARVMEKLGQKPVEVTSSKTKTSKTSKEELASSRKSHRKTSKSSRDEDMSVLSGTESSVLSSNPNRRSGEGRSILSGASGASSINNPKLLATVEDAIRRLILPELDALKEEIKTHQNRSKFDRVSRDSTRETSESTTSRDPSRRRVSKSSSAPHIHSNKPKLVLNRDGDDPGTVLSGSSSHKGRRSSRGSMSERSYGESTRDEEKTHKKSDRSKSKDSHAVAGLTMAALRHHDSRESHDGRKERKKKHSTGSRSRTASVAESVEQDHRRSKHMSVPPLPYLQSELQGSEMTRASILSAESDSRERPSSSSSRMTGTGVEAPIRQVPRGIASPSRTPTRTPVPIAQRLGTTHSNKSLGTLELASLKSAQSFTSQKKAATAALESAAAAKVRALESTAPQASQYEIAEQTPTQGLSPVQSEASYRDEVTSASPRLLRSVHSGGSTSSAARKAKRQNSNLSIQSFVSTPSTKAAHTRRRPNAVTLEDEEEILDEPESPRDIDDFFQKNHEQNELYRRELDSEQGSPVDYRRMTNYTDDSVESPYLVQQRDEKVTTTQDIREIGSNPNFVHTPLAVESAVASLHEPSTMSVLSSPLHRNRYSQSSPISKQHYTPRESELLHHPVHERWEAIRNQAQTLAGQSQGMNSPRMSSPRHSLSLSIDDPPQMHHSAFPTDDHMMPEIGFGVDDASEVDTNPSIIQGPIGGDQYDDQAESLLSRQEERERTPTQYGKTAALGGGAGAAAIAAAAAARVRHEDSVANDDQYHAHAEDDYDEEYDDGEQPYEQPSFAQGDHTPTRSPAQWKDEGYQSANQHGGITPEFRDRTKLPEDDGMDDYDEEGEGVADLFGPNSKQIRHYSGGSHGMSSPLYDSSTGKGIDRIQSKDVVALMDHLTVRDAQRNARDTEILVTLVRSAAEMRNQFEEMKQFIRTQDSMILNNTDKRADLTEQRIMGGPRPQPLGSPRFPRSSTEDIDMEQKKKNVFKRALKGLSMKGDGDIKKIEGMLMQLLGEVEGLKMVHQLSLDQQQTNRSNSLTSYENLRASGDAGYEPEGNANTESSPNQSGYLSNPSSRRIQDMHSGLDVHQAHRISTVEEDEEEYADHDGQFENTERMTTPTQEVRRNNSNTQATPPQATRAFREPQSQENTPKRKHKSNSSSIFGIPKISRWSKTTASTNPDRESLPRNSGSGEKRPYSAASRSNSQVNVPYYDDGQYEPQQDDRLRSSTSLADDRKSIRSERSMRSASPLFPDEELDAAYELELDDPKYQAHRNSLNLQHPQPRPGPTGRHQNHLEHQAFNFAPTSSVGSIASPDYDQWGSNPSLARNRLSTGGASQGPGNLSPISSDGGYSQHSASEQQGTQSRLGKMRDDGPLIPPQPLAGHGQTRQMYSSPNEFASQGVLTPLAPIQEVRYSLETDRGHYVCCISLS